MVRQVSSVRMVRNVPLKRVLALAAGCALATAVFAEDAASPSSAAATGGNPVVAAPGSDKPSASTPDVRPHRRRVISPEVAAQLAAAAPKYTPPPPKPPPVPEDEATDMRDIDKPKNGIIRLPKFVVTQPRPAVLSERAVYTEKGLADLAKKRYFTEAYRALNPIGLPLFGSPDAVAMSLYEQDERLRNMHDLTEDARMISSGDKEQGRYVKRLVDQTYARPGDFDWKPMGK